MKKSISLYKNILLPHLQSHTNDTQRQKINRLKSTNPRSTEVHYISKQSYKNKDPQLEKEGYKIVRNVFDDPRSKNQLQKIARLADMYKLNMQEFVDKDPRFEEYILPILKNENFIKEYQHVFQEDFLWQKTTIHRKQYDSNKLSKTNFTAEHMDITETPNSKLTITAYIAITDQCKDEDSRLVLYPKSHLYNSLIPRDNFDYISSLSHNMNVIRDINEIIEVNPSMHWVRECLYHLLVLDMKEFDILKSTFIIMLYNPLIFNIEPITVELKQGDVLFFLADTLHGSTSHYNKKESRVSLAVRGGEPYYENSGLISKYVRDDFYHKHQGLLRDHFLFSGTKEMIYNVPSREDYQDIIYDI